MALMVFLLSYFTACVKGVGPVLAFSGWHPFPSSTGSVVEEEK